MLVSKLLALFYLTTFTFSYLSTGTGAYFINSNLEKQVIQAGTWWDGSKLVFTGKPTQNNKACPPLDITVEIKNKGFGMIEPTTYEVYYSENGNPKKQGEKVAEDTINPIGEGKVTTLSFQAEEVGSYMFKALQRPGYEENYESRNEIWSEKVMVKCIEKQEVDSTKEDKKEDEKENSNNEESPDQSKIDNTTNPQTETSNGEGTEPVDKTAAEENDGESKQENKDNVTSEKTDEGSSVENDKPEENTEVEDNQKQENITTENTKTESETSATEGVETNEQNK